MRAEEEVLVESAFFSKCLYYLGYVCYGQYNTIGWIVGVGCCVLGLGNRVASWGCLCSVA